MLHPLSGKSGGNTSVAQSQPSDLLVFPFWSSFDRGLKRSTLYFQVLWVSDMMVIACSPSGLNADSKLLGKSHKSLMMSAKDYPQAHTRMGTHCVSQVEQVHAQNWKDAIDQAQDPEGVVFLCNGMPRNLGQTSSSAAAERGTSK